MQRFERRNVTEKLLSTYYELGNKSASFKRDNKQLTQEEQ